MRSLFRTHMAIGLAAASAVAFAATAQASVTIAASATKNMSCSAGVCSPTAKKAVLNVDDLTNMLASGDVKVTTGAGAVTITVASPFSWTSTHRLTLDANLNVSFRAPVTVAGQGAVTIAYNDGGTGGDLIFYPGAKLDFWDSGAHLIINGVKYKLIDELGKQLRKNPSGNYALRSDIYFHRRGPHTFDTIISGVIEGLGHDVNNEIIKQIGTCTGLFGQLTAQGKLRDFNVRSANGYSGGFWGGVVVGCNAGTISHVSADGAMAGLDYVGGIAGSNVGLIEKSRASVQVNGGAWIGGLVGYDDYGSEIDQSYSTGPIIDVGGGAIGTEEAGIVRDCYATGSVYGGGGFVGNVGDATISSSYSTGYVGDPMYSGGFAEFNYSSLTNSYWDVDTSGQTQGCRYGDCTGVTGLSDAQLKSGLPEGFDPKIWGQKASINNGYPYLLANQPPQ